MIELKRCAHCKESKPLDHFAADRRMASGRQSWCKSCTHAYTKDRRDSMTPGDRDALNARRRGNGFSAASARRARRDRPHLQRNATLRSKYGVDGERYETKLAEQGGVCAICGTDQPGGRGTFHIDHDHSCCPGRKSCGECLRGLLCTLCNTALGSFRDDPEILAKAVEYLSQRLKDTLIA